MRRWPFVVGLGGLLACAGGGPSSSQRALHGSLGGPSAVPMPIPEGYDLSFAVTVIELTSPRAVAHAEVTEAVVIDDTGAEIKARRVAQVEVFERPRVAGVGEFAYWVNPGGTRPWDGTLPAGPIRLRVRLSLPPMTTYAKGYRLTVGGHLVTGTIDGSAPS